MTRFLKLFEKGRQERAEFLTGQISEFWPCGASLLDVGSGSGHIAKVLNQKYGLKVEMLDQAAPFGYFSQQLFGIPFARNISKKYGIPWSLYNGDRLPFESESFDATLLSFVLHHARKPLGLFKEALRIAKSRIIIFEDIPRNRWQKISNHWGDSLVNLQLLGHPHNNLTEQEWLNLFARHNLTLLAKKSWVSYLGPFPCFPNTVFVLEK